MTATVDTTLRRSKILEDTVVPARSPWSGWVRAGQVLRLIDLEGQQAIDFLCYNASDYADRYHAANTIKLGGEVYLNQGSVLWSTRARKMMTIIADTCGKHDTLLAACSAELNELRYGVTGTPSCQANFEHELALHGLGPRDVVLNANFFMYAPFGTEGEVDVANGLSKPGDYVELRANMDLLVALNMEHRASAVLNIVQLLRSHIVYPRAGVGSHRRRHVATCRRRHSPSC